MTTFGSDVTVGFDIGCSMQATVRDSPKVGPLATANRLVLLVNAFHGWAHNRQCQVSNHPLYIKGAGLEDLETMERFFSGSNAVAAGIRFATYYHWKQALDIYFQQSDDDKYRELGKIFMSPCSERVITDFIGRFLYNNLQQALDIITQLTPVVEVYTLRHQLQRGCYDLWLQQEQEFFRSLEAEPDAFVLEVGYVEDLIQRDTIEYVICI